MAHDSTRPKPALEDTGEITAHRSGEVPAGTAEARDALRRAIESFNDPSNSWASLGDEPVGRPLEFAPDQDPVVLESEPTKLFAAPVVPASTQQPSSHFISKRPENDPGAFVAVPTKVGPVAVSIPPPVPPHAQNLARNRQITLPPPVPTAAEFFNPRLTYHNPPSIPAPSQKPAPIVPAQGQISAVVTLPGVGSLIAQDSAARPRTPTLTGVAYTPAAAKPSALPNLSTNTTGRTAEAIPLTRKKSAPATITQVEAPTEPSKIASSPPKSLREKLSSAVQSVRTALANITIPKYSLWGHEMISPKTALQLFGLAFVSSLATASLIKKMDANLNTVPSNNLPTIVHTTPAPTPAPVHTVASIPQTPPQLTVQHITAPQHPATPDLTTTITFHADRYARTTPSAVRGLFYRLHQKFGAHYHRHSAIEIAHQLEAQAPQLSKAFSTIQVGDRFEFQVWRDTGEIRVTQFVHDHTSVLTTPVVLHSPWVQPTAARSK